jgi:hypothetical protein
MSDCGYQQLSVNWKAVSKLLRFWGLLKLTRLCRACQMATRYCIRQDKGKDTRLPNKQIEVEGHFTNIWFVSDGDFRGRKEGP